MFRKLYSIVYKLCHLSNITSQKSKNRSAVYQRQLKNNFQLYICIYIFVFNYQNHSLITGFTKPELTALICMSTV